MPLTSGLVVAASVSPVLCYRLGQKALRKVQELQRVELQVLLGELVFGGTACTVVVARFALAIEPSEGGLLEIFLAIPARIQT